MVDIYRVLLGSHTVGFFAAPSWSKAARAGASHHARETGESRPWEQYTALWVNPKHYDREQVPEHLYRQAPEEATATA